MVGEWAAAMFARADIPKLIHSFTHSHIFAHSSKQFRNIFFVVVSVKRSGVDTNGHSNKTFC